MYHPEITNLQAELSKKLTVFLNSFYDHYFALIVDSKQANSFIDDVMKYFYTIQEGKDLRRKLDELNQIEGNLDPAGLDDGKQKKMF